MSPALLKVLSPPEICTQTKNVPPQRTAGVATLTKREIKAAQTMKCTLWTETLEFWRLKVPNSRFALHVLIHGLCAICMPINSRFMRVFQAHLETCLDSPLLCQPLSSLRFALHGLRAFKHRASLKGGGYGKGGGIPHEGERYGVCMRGAERHRTVTQVRSPPSCSWSSKMCATFAWRYGGGAQAAERHRTVIPRGTRLSFLKFTLVSVPPVSSCPRVEVKIARSCLASKAS